MDPEEYLSTMVRPTLREYAEDRSSVRRAFLACVVTFHTIDYIANGEKPAVLRSRVRKECPSFILIDRVAHAFKHASTGNLRDEVQPLKSKQVRSRSSAIFGQAVFGEAIFGDAHGGVIIPGAMHTELYDELQKVISYFEMQIASTAS